MKRFLRNAWYPAVWSAELGRDLFARTILNEPVVLFRQENGQPAAIHDRCPHRFAPLHRGKLRGDAIECAYHGLCFDGAGRCVSNPHGRGNIPAAATVRAFPVIERFNLIWIWPGDAEKADPAKVPDYSYLSDPAYKVLTGTFSVKADYELLNDNLMDTSHAQYLHANFFASDNFDQMTQDIRQDGTTVFNHYLTPARTLPGTLHGYFEASVDVVDYYLESRWDPPSMVTTEVTIAPAGRPKAERRGRIAAHILTPETDRSCFYFYAHARNVGKDNLEIDEQLRTWQRVGFGEQDLPMIEAIQRAIGDVDIMSLQPVSLSIDAAPMRMRRILTRLIEEEGDARTVRAVTA